MSLVFYSCKKENKSDSETLLANNYDLKQLDKEKERFLLSLDVMSHGLESLESHSYNLNSIKNGFTFDVGNESSKLCSDVSMLAGLLGVSDGHHVFRKIQSPAYRAIITKGKDDYSEGVLGLTDFPKKVKDKIVAFFKMIWDKIKQFWKWVSGSKSDDEKTKEVAKELSSTEEGKEKCRKVVTNNKENIKAVGKVVEITNDDSFNKARVEITKIEGEKDKIIGDLVKEVEKDSLTGGNLASGFGGGYGFEVSEEYGETVGKLLDKLNDLTEKQFEKLKDFSLFKLGLVPKNKDNLKGCFYYPRAKSLDEIGEIDTNKVVVLDLYLDERDGVDSVTAFCICKAELMMDSDAYKNKRGNTYFSRFVFGSGRVQLTVDKIPYILTDPNNIIKTLKDVSENRKDVLKEDLVKNIDESMKSKDVKILKEFAKMTNKQSLKYVISYLKESSTRLLAMSKSPMSRDKALKIIMNMINEKFKNETGSRYF